MNDVAILQELTKLLKEVEELKKRVAKLEGLKDVFDPDKASVGPNVPIDG